MSGAHASLGSLVFFPVVGDVDFLFLLDFTQAALFQRAVFAVFPAGKVLAKKAALRGELNLFKDGLLSHRANPSILFFAVAKAVGSSFVAAMHWNVASDTEFLQQGIILARAVSAIS